jgi:hypothetical protein
MQAQGKRPALASVHLLVQQRFGFLLRQFRQHGVEF